MIKALMERALKAIAARLSTRWQQELKRIHFGFQLRRRRFDTSEPEYALLPSLVSPGDWVLDIGANIGHYATRLSELVGPAGRVIAFEPLPETFELLAALVALMPARNVTLMNVAASDATRLAGMEVPNSDTGLANYYLAHLSSGPAAGLNVLCLPVDALAIPHPVRLAKIDAEGHELAVLKGMERLLRRDAPTLIVEDNSEDVGAFLDDLGYGARKLEGSSNRIFSRGGPEARSSARK
jgi:FkbM family methyltransferase